MGGYKSLGMLVVTFGQLHRMVKRAKHVRENDSEVFVMACSHRRRGPDQTVLSRRVGIVNKPLAVTFVSLWRMIEWVRSIPPCTLHDKNCYLLTVV